jgi:hypothetical protein
VGSAEVCWRPVGSAGSLVESAGVCSSPLEIPWSALWARYMVFYFDVLLAIDFYLVNLPSLESFEVCYQMILEDVLSLGITGVYLVHVSHHRMIIQSACFCLVFGMLFC